MTLEENVSLAPLTTFHIGGPALVYIEAESERDIEEAIVLARTRHLPLYPLGGGSNILVPDEGVRGVVLRIGLRETALEEDERGTLLVAGAGARWDTIVETVGARGFFGIENLAGIPGAVGGAVVQNIGAYGAELATVFAYAEVIDSATGVKKRIEKADAAFGYRTSRFKKEPTGIITRVALRFTPGTAPNLSYP